MAWLVDWDDLAGQSICDEGEGSLALAVTGRTCARLLVGRVAKLVEIGRRGSESMGVVFRETTQALGLYADANMIQPSVFSERTHPSLAELPLNDKIIVRTLYDPRITPGMAREEALEVAREVIRELVDGVRRHGVEALYQRPSKSPQP